jgi:hypothetical protein
MSAIRIFKNARIIDGSSNDPVENGCIVIDGPKISMPVKMTVNGLFWIPALRSAAAGMTSLDARLIMEKLI